MENTNYDVCGGTLVSDIFFMILEKIFVKWSVFFIEGNTKTLDMPFWLKVNLTIKEAASYSNIGINRIEGLLKQPKCNFVLYVGNKKLVKRKEFEQYLSKTLEI